MKQNKYREHLYEALVKISNIEDIEQFLGSLCSEAELGELPPLIEVGASIK